MSKKTLEREVKGYPNQKYYSLFVGLAKVKGASKSGLLCDILKEHFDKLPESEQRRLIGVTGGGRTAKNSF